MRCAMIEISNLSVSFSGGVRALDCVSLCVPDNSRTVIVGESGSGKSVLLSAIMRILPPGASVSGSIRADGQELLSLREKEMNRLRGRRIAYIPQGSASSMNPLLTVGYQIAEPMVQFQLATRKNAAEKVIHWLRQLKIGEEEKVAASYPHTLSGGMRQRALIAMGAAAGAPILLADEPTKGLDEERIEAVIAVFERLRDRSILFVSHDLRFAERIADRVCVLYAAQAVESCSKADFFREPLHPYSRLMLSAMPERGLQADTGFAPTHDRYEGFGCRFRERCPFQSERCKEQPPELALGDRKVRCWQYAAR